MAFSQILDITSDDDLTNSNSFQSKKQMVNPEKSQEIGTKFTFIDCSNFDKRRSGAHFVSFLFYNYCKTDISRIQQTLCRI